MGHSTINILRFMNRYSNMRNKAINIKEDEERKRTSCYFGITSIITSIFATIFCVFGAWIFQNFMNTGIYIFALIIGIGFLLCSLILFIWALIRLIFQFSINLNWVSWLSLILFFCGLIGSGFGLVIFLSAL